MMCVCGEVDVRVVWGVEKKEVRESKYVSSADQERWRKSEN